MALKTAVSPSTAPGTSGRVTLGLFILSFFIHLAVVLVVRHYQHPTLWENGSIADYLYHGRGFRIDFFGRTAEPTSLQAPGYPVVLCLFWKLFGETSTAFLLISVTQCVAVASMVWPMGMLSRRWFPEAPSWVAQALVVVYPLYIWYCTRLHHTAYLMALHPWVLWTWLEWSRRGPWQGIGTGVFTAFAALFQPVMLTVYGICGAALLAAAVLKKQWKPATNLILAATAVVLCLTPWTIRNYKIHGRFMLIKDGMGKEFWMGNNPHSTGTALAEGGNREITNAYPPKAYALLGKVPEIVMLDALNAEGWDYIKANPGRTVDMTLHKILWYWTVAPRNLVRSDMGGEALTFRPIYIGYWAAVVGLALLGILTARHSIKEYLGLLAAYFLCYSCVYGVTHVGQARYRGEIEFIFLFGAAAGISFLLSFARSKRSGTP